MLKGLVKVAAVVVSLLKSARVWQMRVTWNVYTCPMSINRDKEHISSSDCELNSCWMVMS